jgi:hypothetical protein
MRMSGSCSREVLFRLPSRWFGRWPRSPLFVHWLEWTRTGLSDVCLEECCPNCIPLLEMWFGLQHNHHRDTSSANSRVSLAALSGYGLQDGLSGTSGSLEGFVLLRVTNMARVEPMPVVFLVIEATGDRTRNTYKHLPVFSAPF